MKKEWFRRNWLWIIVVVGEVILACLIWLLGDWFFGGSRQTFGPLNSYIFIWFSIVIATIAALNSVRASDVASKSLELTRATQRPFLNVTRISVIWSRNDGSPTSINYLIVRISNQGIFPADQVSVALNVSKTDSDNQKHQLVVDAEMPSICFPGEDIENLHFSEAEDKEKLTVAPQGKLKVKIEISFQNKLTQKIHKTNRSYLVQYDPPAGGAPSPIPKEDYWD